MDSCRDPAGHWEVSLLLFPFPSSLYFCLSFSLTTSLSPAMLQWVKKEAPVPISQANLLAFYTSFGSEHTAHQHNLSAFSDPLCAAVAQHCLTRYASRTNTFWTSLLFDMIPSTGQNSHQDASTICHAHICSHRYIKKRMSQLGRLVIPA